MKAKVGGHIGVDDPWAFSLSSCMEGGAICSDKGNWDSLRRMVEISGA